MCRSNRECVEICHKYHCRHAKTCLTTLMKEVLAHSGQLMRTPNNAHIVFTNSFERSIWYRSLYFALVHQMFQKRWLRALIKPLRGAYTLSECAFCNLIVNSVCDAVSTTIPYKTCATPIIVNCSCRFACVAHVVALLVRTLFGYNNGRKTLVHKHTNARWLI